MRRRERGGVRGWIERREEGEIPRWTRVNLTSPAETLAELPKVSYVNMRREEGNVKNRKKKAPANRLMARDGPKKRGNNTSVSA